jgi:quercetin dioxygenase-like cupin family protein
MLGKWAGYSCSLEERTMTGAPKAEVLRLSELVMYQDGSVVSRQIAKAEAGNVTLFAFDAGQELSEHSAPYDALIHMLDGEAEVRIAGQPYAVSAGEAIVLPANQPHAVKALKRFKMLLTMIRS